MILPTKHIKLDRSLIGIGAEILSLLDTSKTISALWIDLQKRSESIDIAASISFDWFILSLDLLYALGAVEYQRGRIWRINQ